MSVRGTAVYEHGQLMDSPSGVVENGRRSISRTSSAQSSFTSRVSQGSVATYRPNSNSPDSNRQHYLLSQHGTFETDSIGSASSMLFSNRKKSSRMSRQSGSGSLQSVDLDDEILVGDEKDLHEACKSGDMAVVEEMAKTGLDLNCRNKHDRTPLHWAAGNGQLDILKTLLDEGAAIDLRDKFGMDALLWSAWFGHTECTKYLLRVGASPTVRNKHGYCWLHCAAQNNHVDTIEILAEEMQEFGSNTVDDAGRSALHVACKYGRKRIAERLIQFGGDPLLADKSGSTSFHVAAKYGFHELVAVFVDAKCNLDLPNADAKTPLHIAAEEGKDLFCKELLAHGADVNAETPDEMSPLHYAVRSGHTETVEVLLENDADIDSGNRHNQTPLHLAVMGRSLEMTLVLLNAHADTNVPDARNEIALHIAAENGLTDIAEALLLTGSSVSLPDEKGKTPLDVAARGNYVTIVDMMIKAERYRQFLRLQVENHNHQAAKQNVSLKADGQAATQHFRMLLYRLASKYLKPIEWKQLAFYWGFTDKHLQAIEEQYTGNKSYKEHGHRMLLIWFHGFTYCAEENPVKGLYEGLAGIQKKELAELMRTKSSQISEEKNCCIS